jgi:hypothetical protein
MKKLAILSMMFFLVLTVVQGQPKTRTLKKLPGADVSELAKSNFVVDFGNIPNVKWKRDDAYDMAVFTRNGKEMSAFYDFNGKLVGTTRQVSYTDIPAKAREDISKKYKDYIVEAVTFFEDNQANETDMILYGMQFDDADNYFVELAKKGAKRIVLEVSPAGDVSYFTELK